MDMNQQLNMLGQTATSVPQDYDSLTLMLPELTQEMKDITNSFNLFIQDLRRRLSDVEKGVDENRSLCDSIAREVNDRDQVIGEEIAASQQRWKEIVDELSNSADEMDEVVEEAVSNFKSHAGDVENAQRKVQDHSTKTSDWAGRLKNGLASEGLAYREGIEEFQKIADEVDSAVKQSIETLGSEIEANLETIRSVAEQGASEVETLVTSFEDRLTDLHLDVLTKGIDDIANLAQGDIEETLRSMLDEVKQAVADALQQILDLYAEADEENSLIREALEPLLDEIEEVFNPVEAMIEPIKQVADGFSAVANIF